MTVIRKAFCRLILLQICLGRIDDSMIYEYIKDLPLQVVEIQHVNSLATFNSLYEYFMFLYAIGSLQKIFNYKGEYEYALKLRKR